MKPTVLFGSCCVALGLAASCSTGSSATPGADAAIGGGPDAAPVADGFEAIEAMAPYIEAQLAEGVRLSSITRHMIGLFPGRPGARLYRRHLATEAVKPGAGLEVLFEAAAHVRRAIEAKAA